MEPGRGRRRSLDRWILRWLVCGACIFVVPCVEDMGSEPDNGRGASMQMVETARGRCAIAVMAKAPRAGRVKTRLCPPLLPEQATALSAAFLRDITENIRAASNHVPADGWIAYAPSGDEALFDGILAEGTRLLLADGRTEAAPGVEGFGMCLLHAMRDLFARGYSAAVVLNSDSPTLPTSVLRETVEALLQGGDRAVLGPADDGGYYLLGLTAPHAGAFADIAWSTETVADRTRMRLRDLGLPTTELRAWYDVDNGDALRRLADELKNNDLHDVRAAATAACLVEIGVLERQPAE